MTDRDVQTIIDSLCDPQDTVDPARCKQLSNLTREEQNRLSDEWTTIPLAKRRQLVSLLNRLAEADVLLDFSAVFRRGLRDPDAEVRSRSVAGLREDESITLIRPFLQMLNEDESMEVRANAASALGRFVLEGELGHLSEERTRDIVEALTRTIANDALPVAVRRRAVESLSYSGDDRVHSIIARAYEDVEDDVRTSAVTAMGRSADEYWRGTVRLELVNESPEVRLEAARAAGELTDPKAVSRLVLLLSDTNSNVLEMAIWALGQIGGGQARQALQRVTQGEDRELRRLAKDAIAEMSLLDEESGGVFVSPEPDEDDGDEYEFDDDDDDEWDDEDDFEDDEDEEDAEWQTLEFALGEFDLEDDTDDDTDWDDED